MPSTVIPIADASRVAEARRVAVAEAQTEGLAEQVCQEVAIIASELATNLLKHAQAGELHISGLRTMGEPGVEILSIDRGPGMSNWQACLTDGYSTAGTAGTGLGAVSRLSHVFDVYSQLGRGTLVLARKFQGVRSAERAERWTFASVRVPYPGETACGDNWSVRSKGRATCLMVADGLGHGILAADASTAAVVSFDKGRGETAATLLEDIHLALRSTRGAAVAIACIDEEGRSIQFAGLGNISGVLLGGPRGQYMVSHNGTAGHEARRFQMFEYAIPQGGTIVMHSDGLTTSWTMDGYPGLSQRHPALIAGVLYRDAKRGRDDACVVVGRYMRE